MLKDYSLTLHKAFEYVDVLNWSIIPVGQDKKPLLASWKEFQKRKPTHEEINNWFSKYPSVNLAVVTGAISNIVVVDIDPRHGGDNKSFENLTTLYVKTGGSGWHYYFLFEKGLQNRAGIQPGIDIRAEAGYAIIPPSVHLTGNSYEWRINPFSENSIQPLPEFVKAWLKPIDGEKDSKWNSEVLYGVKEGKRNESAASVIGKLLSRFPEHEWDTEAWMFTQAWNEKNIPPLSQQELQSVFLSISKTAKNNRFNQTTELLHIYRDSGAMQWKDPVQITSLTSEANNIDWILEGFIAKGHSTLFNALWKIGKSTFLSWLIKHIQTEDVFIGHAVKSVKVLIISEESKSTWARRKDFREYTEGIFIICRPVKARLHAQDWIIFLNEVKKFCLKEDISLVIFDTIANFWPVRDENVATQVNEALLPFNDLLETNIALLIVHHDRKSGGDEGTASRGSGALPSFVDIIIEFKRFDKETSTDTRRVIKSYSRFDETPPEIVIELTDSGYITHGTKVQAKMEEKTDILLEILPDSPNGLTRKQILEKWPLDEHIKQPDDSTIFRWLKKLQEQSKIKITGKSSEKGTPDLWGKCIALQTDPYKDAIQVPQQPSPRSTSSPQDQPRSEDSEGSKNSKDDKEGNGSRNFNSNYPLLRDDNLIRQEKALREKLPLLEKSSKEYEEFYHQWFSLRSEGESRGLWNFLPSPME